jgi:hypothetical protein
MFMDGFESLFRRHMSIFSPIAEEIIAVFAQARDDARRESLEPAGVA